MLTGFINSKFYFFFEKKIKFRYKYEMNLNKLLNQIPPFNITKKNFYPHSIYEYFEYYKINYTNTKHFFGYYLFNDLKIAAHLFKPENPIDIIITLHGFLDHTGYLNHLIKHLLDNHYAVFSIDLPGHGLSGGDKYSINNFKEYAQCLDILIKIIQKDARQQPHIIGFSTGCSAVIEYLYYYQDIFNKIIFISPLIKSGNWYLSKMGYYLMHKMMRKIPRLYKSDTDDKEFLYFRKHIDPLQQDFCSMQWVKALIDWNKSNIQYPGFNRKIDLIQGKKDTTVFWKYNYQYLLKKFLTVTPFFIDQGRHQLLNESGPALRIILNKISEILGN
jgi:alpha-beta hydrolase superfamily lysophospholipase